MRIRKISLVATITRTAPWAHMRRNFYELAIPGPAPIASEALKRIAEFYAIEKDISGRSAEERRLIRQHKSRPLADTFEQWLRAKLALISKGKLPDGIRNGHPIFGVWSIGGSPRFSSASGDPPVSILSNAKRVHRLMKKHGLLPRRHTGRRGVATTTEISGERIRDMMVQCVERRFGDVRSPHTMADR
jgi:hypothetical protein